jgi:hypothetical protein
VKLNTERAMGVLLALTLIMGAGNLWASWDEVHSSEAAQQRQGEIVEAKLCSTFGKLAALKPPPGNPAANPSRAYEDQLHTALDALGTDLGCR